MCSAFLPPPVIPADARNCDLRTSHAKNKIPAAESSSSAFVVAPRECRSKVAVFCAYLRDRYDGGGEPHAASKGRRGDRGAVLPGDPRRFYVFSVGSETARSADDETDLRRH